MNSGSSSELENDVFLPATTRSSFLSSGMRFFRRRRQKSKNINDSNNMKELLTIPESKPSLYSDIVKNKEELKFELEGPIIVPKLKKKHNHRLIMIMNQV